MLHPKELRWGELPLLKCGGGNSLLFILAVPEETVNANVRGFLYVRNPCLRAFLAAILLLVHELLERNFLLGTALQQ